MRLRYMGHQWDREQWTVGGAFWHGGVDVHIGPLTLHVHFDKRTRLERAAQAAADRAALRTGSIAVMRGVPIIVSSVCMTCGREWQPQPLTDLGDLPHGNTDETNKL